MASKFGDFKETDILAHSLILAVSQNNMPFNVIFTSHGGYMESIFFALIVAQTWFPLCCNKCYHSKIVLKILIHVPTYYKDVCPSLLIV